MKPIIEEVDTQPQPLFQIVINVMPPDHTGESKVMLAGHIDDLGLALDIMESATTAIKGYHRQKRQQGGGKKILTGVPSVPPGTPLRT